MQTVKYQFEINPLALRAAQFTHCKDDVRYYLNGIHLKTDGTVESCNGYVAFATKTDADIPEELIIALDSKIPNSARKGEVHLMDDDTGFIKLANEKQKPLKTIFFNRIEHGDRPYPDLEKTFFNNHQPEPIQAIRLNAEYHALAGKMFGFNAVHVSFNGQNKGVLYTLKPSEGDYRLDNEAQLMVMPMRID